MILWKQNIVSCQYGHFLSLRSVWLSPSRMKEPHSTPNLLQRNITSPSLVQGILVKYITVGYGANINLIGLRSSF